jgi:hypothetical protein
MIELQKLTFIIESVNSVDAGTFVVPSEEEEVFWVFDFVSKKQADGLKGLFATVHVVAQEQIVLLWWETTVLKQA